MTRDKHLNLIFPQWQGAGTDNTLFRSALALARACPGIAPLMVPVPETGTLELKKGIWGYDPILTQIKAAGQIILESAPQTILTLGGDCGVEPMPVSYLNRLHQGRMTLVWLDAHADLNTPETSPSGHFHGMPLACLLGLGDDALCRSLFSTLSPDQVILAGLRNPDRSEMALINDMTRVSVQDMENDPDALGNAIQAKGHDTIYVHVDLDVLDPARFPQVGVPEPGGLNPETLVRILRSLKPRYSLAGMGLTEFIADSGDQALPSDIRSLMEIMVGCTALEKGQPASGR